MAYYPQPKPIGAHRTDFPGNYVVVDLETTGLSPETHEIIEIGALKVVNHEVSHTFSTLIQPKCMPDSYITSLTGIHSDMLKDAPSITDVLPDFARFLGTAIFAGHNVPFDWGFLNKAYRDVFQQTIENEYMDSLILSRKLIKGLKRYRLNDLCQYFKVSDDGHHRAVNDCYMTKACLDGLRQIALLQEGDEPQQWEQPSLLSGLE